MRAFLGSERFGVVLLLLSGLSFIPLISLRSPVFGWWEVGALVAIPVLGIWGLVLLVRADLPWNSTRRGKGKVTR